MKLKIKKLTPYILTILAVTLPWFFSKGYVFFTDFVWGPHLPLVWQNNWFLIHLFVTVLGYIFSIALLEKVFISLTLFAVIMGGKKLAEEISRMLAKDSNEIPSSWLVYVVSLFSLFNPFVYDRVMYGQFGVVLSFGLFLLCLAELLSYIRNRRISELVWFAISTGFMILLTPHFAFMLALPAIVFSIYVLRKGILNWQMFAKYAALVLGIIILINANWIIGSFTPNSSFSALVTQGISQQDLVAFETSGSTSSQVVTNVLLMSGFWGKDQFRYIDLSTFREDWGRSFLVLLPLILLGVWVSMREKKWRLYSSLLVLFFVISVLLSIGIKLPVARELTEFLYNYLPFYKIMREPQKWVAVIVAIYLLYLTVGCSYLLGINRIKKEIIAVSIFLIGVIIMQTPFLLWGLHAQAKPVNYPTDWYATNTMLTEKGACNGETLFLPWHLYMGFSWIGNVVNNPAPYFFRCPVLSGTNMEWGGIYDNSKDKNSDQVLSWLVAKGKTDLLENKQLNIRFIILAKEVDWKGYDWLDSLSTIKLVSDTSTLKLYAVSTNN